ncbi:outer membrane autotransporter barrel domain-containing protein [Modicisalibacter muralis]|uniref:Outer membrane autotransporter barrel domain-containing protein n=1 Tax=Modicisalibacter muralis TaxID=119000 RepID=A0A1G9IZJ5_9GAMM|nr:autotransporter domain-containing protein [Halomonas muralis]SDL30515.1 outer membrane autotransporter barrel domain-containing protein [Halomonas muralis]
MNHIYRTVFSHARGLCMVASELTRKRGRGIDNQCADGGAGHESCAWLTAFALALLLVAGSALADGGDGGDGAVAPGSGGAGGTAASPDGGDGGEADGGGGGGGGVSLATGIGGAGGTGGDYGGTGGAGGAPALVTADGSNAVPLVGIAGGAGSDGLGAPSAGAGGGGGGGFGWVITGAGASSTSAAITGGAGGDGGRENGGGSGGGGGGGQGGGGVLLTGGGDFTTSHMITGDAGGDGGRGDFAISHAGDGGAGGAGVVLTAGGSVTTAAGAAITGGAGGNGGNTGDVIGGRGGDGGAGVSGSGFTLVNDGQIAGGVGGLGGGSDTKADGPDGAGGIGVYGSNLTIINSGTIAGGLSGDGSTGANAIEFTGGTNRLEVRDGSVINGNVDATVSADDTFALGGATDSNFDVSQIGSSAQYQGFESFDKTGASTWTLTGSGVQDWTISAGTLQAGSDDALGDGAAYIVNGGTLDLNNYDLTMGTLSGAGGEVSLGTAALTVDQATDTSYAGIISGAGGLTKTGAGALTLSGANTYTGGTTINSGTLQLGDGGTTGSIAGDVEIAAPGTLAFNRGDSFTFAGVFTGGGAIGKLGTGTTTLTGDSSGFTGTTTISGGTLLVGDESGNGSLGGTVAVTSDGTLGGSGTVGTMTVANGGSITPGNSIGTLNVAGNVTFAAGSIYEVEVDPAGTASDLIHATGTATLNGGSVIHIGETGNYQPSSTYTILTADGGVTGTFADATSNFAFLDPTLIYDPNNVVLELIRNDNTFASVARTRNQRATAGGIESLGAGGAVYDAIVTHAGSDAALRDGYDSLSGELHASTRIALIEDSRFVREAANERLRFLTGDTPDAAMPAMAHGNETTSHAIGWVRPFGNWGHNDGNGNVASLDRDTQGIIAGVDTQVSEHVRVGLLTGYSQTDLDAGDGRGSADIDSAHAGVYAGAQYGALALRGGAFYSHHAIDTQRHAQVGSFNERLDDERDADMLQAYAELAYAIDTGPLTLEPFANIAHVHLHSDSEQESGGDAALRSGSQTSSVTFTTLGVRPSLDVTLGSTRASLYGSLGWRHAFADTTPELEQRFAGGDTFTIAGTPIAEDAAVVEAGIGLPLSERASLNLAYGGQYGDGMEDHSGRAMFEWRF